MFSKSCLEFFAIILSSFTIAVIYADFNSSNATIYVKSSDDDDAEEGFPVWLYAVIPIAVIILVGLIVLIACIYCRRVQKDDGAYMMWDDSDFELANAYAKESEFLLEKIEQELLDEQQQYEIPIDSIQTQQRVSLGGKRVGPVVTTAVGEKVEEKPATHPPPPLPDEPVINQDPFFVAIIETPTKKKHKKEGRRRSKSQGHKKKKSSGSHRKHHSSSIKSTDNETTDAGEFEISQNTQNRSNSEAPGVIKHLSLASLSKGGRRNQSLDIQNLLDKPEPQMIKCASVGSNLNKIFQLPLAHVPAAPTIRRLPKVSSMMRAKQFAKSMEALHCRNYKELESPEIYIGPDTSTSSKEVDPRRVLSADDIQNCTDGYSVYEESSVMSSHTSINDTRSWSGSVIFDQGSASEISQNKQSILSVKDACEQEDNKELAVENPSQRESSREISIIIDDCDETLRHTDRSKELTENCDTQEEIPYVAINNEQDTCSSADCSTEQSPPTTRKHFITLHPLSPTADTTDDSIDFDYSSDLNSPKYHSMKSTDDLSYNSDLTSPEYHSINSLGRHLSQSNGSSVYAEAVSDFDDGERSEPEEFYDIVSNHDEGNTSKDSISSAIHEEINSNTDLSFVIIDEGATIPYITNHNGNNLNSSEVSDYTFDTSEEIDVSSVSTSLDMNVGSESFTTESESLLAKISEEDDEPIMTSSQDNLHDGCDSLQDSVTVDVPEDDCILEETMCDHSPV